MKITASITKFLTKALGETVGGFLAGIITGPLNSLATTAYYIGEGDFKGLVKHMGQMLLQAAIQIAVFLVLGPILQAVGSFLSTAGTAAINFGTNLATQAGSAIGQFVGNVIATVGTVIQNVGNGLIKFAKVLKARSSGGIDGFLGDTASNFANSLNPLTSYANTFSNATTSFATGGLEKLLIDSAVRIDQKFAQYKVEQKIQESKLSSFYKTVLSSVSNTTIDGLAYSLSPSTYPEYQKILDESDANKNSPPINKPSLASRILTGIRNAGKAIANVLKGASGLIKSIFITPDSQTSTKTQLRLEIDANGNVGDSSYREGSLDINQTTQTKNGITTIQKDGGNLAETKINPETGEVDYYAEIGGLKADESGIDSLLGGGLGEFDQGLGFGQISDVPAVVNYQRQRLGTNRQLFNSTVDSDRSALIYVKDLLSITKNTIKLAKAVNYIEAHLAGSRLKPYVRTLTNGTKRLYYGLAGTKNDVIGIRGNVFKSDSQPIRHITTAKGAVKKVITQAPMLPLVLNVAINYTNEKITSDGFNESRFTSNVAADFTINTASASISAGVVRGGVGLAGAAGLSVPVLVPFLLTVAGSIGVSYLLNKASDKFGLRPHIQATFSYIRNADLDIGFGVL